MVISPFHGISYNHHFGTLHPLQTEMQHHPFPLLRNYFAHLLTTLFDRVFGSSFPEFDRGRVNTCQVYSRTGVAQVSMEVASVIEGSESLTLDIILGEEASDSCCSAIYRAALHPEATTKLSPAQGRQLKLLGDRPSVSDDHSTPLSIFQLGSQLSLRVEASVFPSALKAAAMVDFGRGSRGQCLADKRNNDYASAHEKSSCLISPCKKLLPRIFSYFTFPRKQYDLMPCPIIFWSPFCSRSYHPSSRFKMNIFVARKADISPTKINSEVNEIQDQHLSELFFGGWSQWLHPSSWHPSSPHWSSLAAFLSSLAILDASFEPRMCANFSTLCSSISSM